MQIMKRLPQELKDDGGELITNSTLDVEYHENKSNFAVLTTELSFIKFLLF